MSNTKSIIIAEDDKTEQSFIKDGFNKSGLFSIVSIEPNGHKLLTALEKMDRKKLPDIILSDINMPLMTGFEVLTRIKKNPGLSKIPFVIFTTSKEQATENTAYAMGADKFLMKPANFTEYDAFAKELYKMF